MGSDNQTAIENAVMLTSCFMQHSRNEEFTSRYAPALGGFSGMCEMLVNMAETLADLEYSFRHYWDDSAHTWQEVCERYVDRVVAGSLDAGALLPVRTQLAVAIAELDKMKGTE